MICRQRRRERMMIDLKDWHWELFTHGGRWLELFQPNRVYYNRNLRIIALVANETKEGGLVISAPAVHFAKQHVKDELASVFWLVILDHGTDVVKSEVDGG